MGIAQQELQAHAACPLHTTLYGDRGQLVTVKVLVAY